MSACGYVVCADAFKRLANKPFTSNAAEGLPNSGLLVSYGPLATAWLEPCPALLLRAKVAFLQRCTAEAVIKLALIARRLPSDAFLARRCQRSAARLLVQQACAAASLARLEKSATDAHSSLSTEP